MSDDALAGLSTRVRAVGEAFAAGHEAALRDELRQLADEAAMLSVRLDPLTTGVASATHQRQMISAERDRTRTA
jgi:hypothetical protein